MKHLIGQLVHVKLRGFHKDYVRYVDFPSSGRLVKVMEDGSAVLIVNPECLNEEQVSFGPQFQWGYWLDLSHGDVSI